MYVLRPARLNVGRKILPSDEWSSKITLQETCKERDVFGAILGTNVPQCTISSNTERHFQNLLDCVYHSCPSGSRLQIHQKWLNWTCFKELVELLPCYLPLCLWFLHNLLILHVLSSLFCCTRTVWELRGAVNWRTAPVFFILLFQRYLIRLARVCCLWSSMVL